MNKNLNLYIILLVIICALHSLKAQDNNDSINEKSFWNTVIPTKLSPDGKWAIISQTDNTSSKSNKTYFVNTKTKEKKEFSHLDHFYDYFLDDGLFIAKDNGKIIVHTLNHNDSLVISNIKNFDVSKQNQLLIYLNNEFDVSIMQLNEKLNRNKIILTKSNIQSFYLSKNSKHLILLSKDNKILHVNLSDFSIKKITSIDNSIEKLQWNIQQDAFLIKSNKNKFKLVDLNTYNISEIKIPFPEKTSAIDISFFSNNDLFISFNEITNQPIPETQYIDIWQTNSKHLIPSSFSLKYITLQKAFVYKTAENILTQLDTSNDTNYLNIGVPGFLLSFNPYLKQDFSTSNAIIDYHLFDIKKLKNIALLTTTTSKVFSLSKDNKHLLYPKTSDNAQWEILSFETLKKTLIIKGKSEKVNLTPIWSKDSKSIIYASNSILKIFNIEDKKIREIGEFTKANQGQKIYLINNKQKENNSQFLNLKSPLYFYVNSQTDNRIYIYEKDNLQHIYETDNIINLQTNFNNPYSDKANAVLFSIENYNLPPKILILQGRKIKELINSPIDPDLYSWRKKVEFTYSDKHKVTLHGSLLYPKDYSPNKKYPMIVNVYDLTFSNSLNYFTTPLPVASHSGFNPTLLSEKGYFVLQAQTYVSEEGATISAIDCTVNAVEKALIVEHAIDKENLGIIGHSFGGYKSAAIITGTDIFKAAIAGAGLYDILGQFNFAYSYMRLMPDWYRTEKVQLNFNQKYSENPEKYYKNSPLLNAYKINTPILLWTGLEDINVPWKNTQKMFLALKREKKPVIALFYNKIAHNLSRQKNEAKANIDLTYRIIDWFDYHLKNNKDIQWIENGLNLNKYSKSYL